jgi:hypothetical protein
VHLMTVVIHNFVDLRKRNAVLRGDAIDIADIIRCQTCLRHQNTITYRKLRFTFENATNSPNRSYDLVINCCFTTLPTDSECFKGEQCGYRESCHCHTENLVLCVCAYFGDSLVLLSCLLILLSVLLDFAFGCLDLLLPVVVVAPHV